MLLTTVSEVYQRKVRLILSLITLTLDESRLVHVSVCNNYALLIYGLSIVFLIRNAADIL